MKAPAQTGAFENLWK